MLLGASTARYCTTVIIHLDWTWTGLDLSYLVLCFVYVCTGIRVCVYVCMYVCVYIYT